MNLDDALAWFDWQSRWNPDGYFPPGREDLPACLWDLWVSDAFVHADAAFYAHVVADAWSGAEVPMRALRREDWIEL